MLPLTALTGGGVFSTLPDVNTNSGENGTDVFNKAFLTDEHTRQSQELTLSWIQWLSIITERLLSSLPGC